MIQSQRKSERAGSRGILRTPTWWFNARNRLRSMASASASAMTPAFTSVSSSERSVEAPLPYAGTATSGIKGGAFAFRMDPERQQISLRVSYITGMVAAFSMVVVIGLAYMAGRNTRPSPMPMLSSLATEQIRQLPPQRSVLDIRETTTASSKASTSDAATTAVEAVSLVRETSRVAPTFNDPRPPTTVVVEDRKRSIGLNYVVIQSYPDVEMAREAVDALEKSGVPTTIERGLKGWSSNLHLVVGTHGFNRISAPEYRAYIKKIEDVSDQFAGKKSFRAFQPIAKKWDRGS